MAHDSFAAGGPDEFTPETDQTAGGNDEFQLGAAISAGFHVLHLALAGAQFFDAAADRWFWYVHHQGFHRLAGGPINGAVDHLRLRDLKLIAFTAHGLDQDAEVELTTTTHSKPIW